MADTDSTRTFTLDRRRLIRIMQVFSELAALEERPRLKEKPHRAISRFQFELVNAVYAHPELDARTLMLTGVSTEHRTVEIKMDEEVVLRFIAACEVLKNKHALSRPNPFSTMARVAADWFPGELHHFDAEDWMNDGAES